MMTFAGSADLLDAASTDVHPLFPHNTASRRPNGYRIMDLARVKAWGRAALAAWVIVLMGCFLGITVSVAARVGTFDGVMLGIWRKRIIVDLIVFGPPITLYILIAYAALNAARRRILRLAKGEDSEDGVFMIGGIAAVPAFVVLLFPDIYAFTWVLIVVALAMVIGAFLAIRRITGNSRAPANG